MAERPDPANQRIGRIDLELEVMCDEEPGRLADAISTALTAFCWDHPGVQLRHLRAGADELPPTDG